MMSLPRRSLAYARTFERGFRNRTRVLSTVVSSKLVTLENVNPHVLECKYEVRGEVYLAAVKRASEGKSVVATNVGNPQALGQKPLTFNRQVLSLCVAPFLMENPEVVKTFPTDVVQRAKSYVKAIAGGVGAYQDSRGNSYIRNEIKTFIERQPNVKVESIDNIFITNGASESVRNILTTLIRGPQDGIMVPIPQYPLYSAAIGLYNGSMVPYYLQEASGWALSKQELEESYQRAKDTGVTPRALVLINPGNPTGQCLDEQNLQLLLEFCVDKGIILMADEVYQENIYNSSRPFISARAALANMSDHYKARAEVVSFHTVSKGFLGECGLRGGYMELHNFDPAVVDIVYKMSSINLCSNILGSITVGLMVNPPKPGDASYDLYLSEKDGIVESLKRRARKMTDAFNSLDGVSCQETDGAMYSFPQIHLPPKFLAAAEAKGKEGDVLYCLELLDETGLSCVPGSGFQQVPGTFHLRTTILPSEDQFDEIVGKFVSFHKAFMAKYA